MGNYALQLHNNNIIVTSYLHNTASQECLELNVARCGKNAWASYVVKSYKDEYVG